MVRYLILISMIAGLAGCGNTPNAPQMPYVVSGQFDDDLTAFRTANGLARLQASPTLAAVAQAHAQDMVNRAYFSHQSPGGPHGATMTARMAASGCRPRAAAENIAQGQTSAAAVFTAWQGSEGHRTNMLGDKYTRYGLGRADTTWVAVFAAGC